MDLVYRFPCVITATHKRRRVLAGAAPEVLWGSGPYDAKQADVWSCGVMLYVMLFGEYPFMDKHDVLRGIQFPSKPNVSASVKDLILRLATRDASARIALEDICKHPWAAQVHDTLCSAGLDVNHVNVV